MALLVADDEPEAALAPGFSAIELDTSARTYLALARALTAAACASSCQARAQDQKDKASIEGTKRTKAPARGKDSGTLNAGAMWRYQQAGRNFQAAAMTEPKNEAAQEAARVNLPMSELNGFRVSSTAELMKLGRCSVYEGTRLGGHRCPRATEDGLPEATKHTKKKKKRKMEQ